MTRAGRILWTLAAVAAGMFAVLAVMSVGWLSPEGLSNFDARFFGYDVDEAQAYLAVLPDPARKLYLGLFRWIDTVFPVLAAVAICSVLWLNPVFEGVFPRVFSMVMPAVYMVMDLTENALVAQMLRSDGLVGRELVQFASGITFIKWVFLVNALGMALVGWQQNRKKSM